MSKQRTAVPVNAAPETVFSLIERDRTEFTDDELVRSSRLNDVPFGAGYLYKQTRFHQGEWCEMVLRVTAWDPPRLFEEEWSYACRVSGKTITGKQRFEVETDANGLILVGFFERRMPGLSGVFESALRALCSPKGQLLHLAMRAEAVTLAHAAPV